MALDMRPLHTSFGVEIAGIDVRRIDEAVFREVARALDDHSVLLFPRQSLTDEEQIAFSERFGPLETTIRSIASQAATPIHVANLSNVDAEGRLIPTGDKRNLYNAGTFLNELSVCHIWLPAHASLLSAREVPPEGGETVDEHGDRRRDARHGAGPSRQRAYARRSSAQAVAAARATRIESGP